MNVAVRSQELFDVPGLVSREVVSDDVNLFFLGLVGHDIGEKRNKLGRSVPCGGLAQHLTGLGIEGGVQRERAVAEILKSVTLCAPRRQWQHRIESVQRLNCRLFIDTEHHGVLRRIQVQPDDIGSLGLKVRIVGSEIAFEQMRLDAMLGPNPGHRHVRNIATQFGGQFARRPMRGTVSRLLLGGACQNPRLASIRHLVALAPCMTSEQACQSITGKAFAPAVNVAVAAVQLGANLGLGEPIGQQQNQPGMARRIGPAIPRCSLLMKFHVFALGQFHRNLHGYYNTSDLNVTVH